MTAMETIVGASRGTLARGTRLSGIYEIDTLLATGGMGEVYRAHTIETGDPVAIKMIRWDLATDDTFLALFRKEAAALYKIQHEAIIRYYVAATDPVLNRPYLAMELIEGESLTSALARGPLPPEAIVTLMERLASGLAVAHDLGIVHRDLAPDNIFLPGGDPARAKIIDFGVARSAFGGDSVIGASFAGKLNFVSPEQVGLFDAQVTALSDMYSLGLTLAAAASGSALDMGGTHVSMVQKRQVVPDLTAADPKLRTMLTRMLQPNPKDRPAGMRDVVTWARDTAKPTRQAKTAGARSSWTKVVGGLVGALLLLGGGGFVLTHRTTETTSPVLAEAPVAAPASVPVVRPPPPTPVEQPAATPITPPPAAEFQPPAPIAASPPVVAPPPLPAEIAPRPTALAPVPLPTAPPPAEAEATPAPAPLQSAPLAESRPAAPAPDAPPIVAAATPPPAVASAPVIVSATTGAASLAAGSTFRDCLTCPKMVVVGGGILHMGSNGDATERPIHKVTLHAFAIGAAPITVDEWTQCVADKSCHTDPGGDPASFVHNLSFDDATDYVTWLSRLTGQSYRLPSEAEWEFAARAGTTTRYWWGDQFRADLSPCRTCGDPADRPPGSARFQPNPFGLLGVTGSVAQWVADCWHKSYVKAPADGSAWSMPACQTHVLRGGAWTSAADGLRVTNREFYDAAVRYPGHGFRVARNL